MAMNRTTDAASPDERPASERVVAAVAAETDDDPTAVGPLYHAIDPDALDRLFATNRGCRNGVESVTFTFAGCEVVVDGDGTVDVTELEATRGDDADPARAEATTGERQ